MGPSHKEMGTKTPRCSLLKAFRKERGEEKEKKKKKKGGGGGGGGGGRKEEGWWMLHRSHTAEHSVWDQMHVYVCTGVHRVTDLEKIPVRIYNAEAPTPLLVVWSLFISPMSFHLSRALLGVWRFGLFRCVYSSFHNRLDLIREPTFYWVFYFIFPIYPVCFIICKDKNVLLVLVRSTSDFVASLGYGLGLG